MQGRLRATDLQDNDLPGGESQREQEHVDKAEELAEGMYAFGPRVLCVW